MAQEQNIKNKHKNYLPEEVMNVIKPVYKDLSDLKLLKRCLYGITQNPNESFNCVIWSRVPKTAFVGLKNLQIGVNDSVISYNEGAIGKANVFERLGITPGKFMIEGLKRIDENRIKKANKEVQEANKKKRVRRRLLKRRKEDSDFQDYVPEGF